MASIDLSLLPAPEIIKTLSYEDNLTATKARLVTAFAEKGVTYDVENLETDTAVIIAETKGYDELLLYARTNDVARSNLLFFATGGDLENLVAADVQRMVGESDDRLRTRYILARLNRSEERYKFAAMNADTNVEDVSVYRVGSGPEIEVAILAANNDGIADQALLDSVSNVIETQSGRAINDVISVVPAVKTQVNVEANIWLLPDADSSILTILEQHVKDAWNSLAVMGLDLTPSWLMRELHSLGVQRVEITNILGPIVAADNEAIAINTVSITDMGRAH